MKEALTFDDVLIVPKFSKILSRQDVDLNLPTDGIRLPVISSNMDTITGTDMANAMMTYGANACLHRFCSIEENVKMFRASKISLDIGETDVGEMHYFLRPMVSIGVGEKELDRAYALYSNGAAEFIIDVAHGAQLNVANQVKALKEIIRDNGIIIVGNFATGDSVKEFLDYTGAIVDGIKVGIGPGSACTTRIKTGVGYPQLSAILDVVNTLRVAGVPVVADGGMRTSGDIAKALGAGASMVMLGGMLSGTKETPGIITNEDGHEIDVQNMLVKPTGNQMDWYNDYSVKLFKKYRGSASQESYRDQGKDAAWRTAEGESFLVPYKGSVIDVLREIESGLRSAFAYVGASNLAEFQRKVEFVKVSPSTVTENAAHGKKARCE